MSSFLGRICQKRQFEAQCEREQQRARINSRKCGKEDHKRAATAPGQGSVIVLNTEQCREVNRVRARERR